MYRIMKVCPNCYNEKFENDSDDGFVCVNCKLIYTNVNQLEDMDFEAN